MANGIKGISCLPIDFRPLLILVLRISNAIARLLAQCLLFCIRVFPNLTVLQAEKLRRKLTNGPYLTIA